MKKIQFILPLLMIILFTSCSNHYKKGKEFFNKGQYQIAISNLELVDQDDENYEEALKLLKLTDSIVKTNIRNDFIKDSIIRVQEKIKLDSVKTARKTIADKNKIKHLKEEILDIKKFNGNKYRNELSSLINEISLFKSWANMAENAKNSNNKKLIQEGKNIEYHLKKLQIREFPRIRANYAKILKNKLWEEDIKVSVFGKGKTTLQFTGATFAANKNKKDFQSALNEIVNNFRFKRINYKWYKYDDTYTYYTLENDRDSKLQLY